MSHSSQQSNERMSTLNRKSLICLVMTKHWGSVIITKPLALRRSLCARKASGLYNMTLYYQILMAESHCFTKGTVYPYYSLFALQKQMDHMYNLACLLVTYFVLIKVIRLYLESLRENDCTSLLVHPRIPVF